MPEMSSQNISMITCTAPVNIAVIKYCKCELCLLCVMFLCLHSFRSCVEVFRILHTGGKRDEELILPINSSLSVTLHQDQVRESAGPLP